MIAGDFDSISKAEIDALVASGEPERRTIEYKLKLPAKDDDADTREFLADASSLANAAGGDLIFGIRAKDGVPESARTPTKIYCGLRTCSGMASTLASPEFRRGTSMDSLPAQSSLCASQRVGLVRTW